MSVLYFLPQSEALERPSVTRKVAEWGSHTPPEDRRARSSGAGCGYLSQRRIPLTQAKSRGFLPVLY